MKICQNELIEFLEEHSHFATELWWYAEGISLKTADRFRQQMPMESLKLLLQDLEKNGEIPEKKNLLKLAIEFYKEREFHFLGALVYDNDFQVFQKASNRAGLLLNDRLALCAGETIPKKVFFKDPRFPDRSITAACFDVKKWASFVGLEYEEPSGGTNVKGFRNIINVVSHASLKFPRILESDEKTCAVVDYSSGMKKIEAPRKSGLMTMLKGIGHEFSNLEVFYGFNDLSAILELKTGLRRIRITGQGSDEGKSLSNHCFWFSLAAILPGYKKSPLRIKNEVLLYLKENLDIFTEDDLRMKHGLLQKEDPEFYRSVENLPKEEFLKKYYDEHISKLCEGPLLQDVQKIVYYFRTKQVDPVPVRVFYQLEDFDEHFVIYDHPPVDYEQKSYGDLLCFKGHCDAIVGLPLFLEGNYFFPNLITTKGKDFQMPSKICERKNIQEILEPGVEYPKTLTFSFEGNSEPLDFYFVSHLFSFHLVCAASFLFSLDVNSFEIFISGKKVLPLLVSFQPKEHLVHVKRKI